MKTSKNKQRTPLEPMTIFIHPDVKQQYVELAHHPDVRQHLKKERSNAGHAELMRRVLKHGFLHLKDQLLSS